MIRLVNRATALSLAAVLCSELTAQSAVQVSRAFPQNIPRIQNLQPLFGQEALQARIVQANADQENKSIAAPIHRAEGRIVQTDEPLSVRPRPAAGLYDQMRQRFLYIAILGPSSRVDNIASKTMTGEFNRDMPPSRQYASLNVRRRLDVIIGLAQKLANGDTVVSDSAKDSNFELAKLIPPQEVGQMHPSDETVVNIVNRLLQIEPFRNAYGIVFSEFPQTPGQWELFQKAGLKRAFGEPIFMDLLVVMDEKASREELFNFWSSYQEPGKPIRQPAFDREWDFYDQQTRPVVKKIRETLKDVVAVTAIKPPFFPDSEENFTIIRRQFRQALRQFAEAGGGNRVEGYMDGDAFLTIMRQAKDLRAKGDEEGVVRILVGATKRFPGKLAFVTFLASAYKRLGRYKEAIPLLLAAVKLQPENTISRVELGSLYFYTKEFEKAIEQVEEVIKLEPRNQIARRTLSLYYRTAGRKREARNIELEGVRTSPDSVNAKIALALGYLDDGESLLATEQARGVLAVDDANVEARRVIAKGLVLKGQHDAAIQEAARAVKSDPENAKAWRTLGQIYQSAEDYSPALEALREAVRLSPLDRVMRVSLIRCLLEAKYYAQALEVAEDSHRAFADDANLQHLLDSAKSYVQSSRFQTKRMRRRNFYKRGTPTAA